jgi:DNA-binding NtrC family response regulator
MQILVRLVIDYTFVWLKLNRFFTYLSLNRPSAAIEDFKKGKEAPLKFLIGKVMAASKGKANPKVAEEIEKQTILQAMKECGNNLSQVAALLGISRGALYRRLEKYNLPVGNS